MRDGSRRRPEASPRWFGGALLLATAILLTGCDQSPPPTQQAAPPPAVEVVRATERPMTQGTEFIGRVEAIDKLDVRARVTGFLYARHFQEGDRVKAGELLFTIEQAPFAAEVSAREAAVQRAEAEVRVADLQVERGRDLVRTNNIPQSTLDERIAQQGTAHASLAAAQADLERARIQYGYTEIRAVFDGRAGRSPLSPGNVVSPDSGVLVTVVRDDPVRVTFPVTQRELLSFRRAGGTETADRLKVRVRLPDGSMLDTTGQIAFIDVAANRSTNSVLVQAVIPNPHQFLSDGQAVTVVIEEAQPAVAIVIPQSAVQIDQQGPFVLAVGAENKVEVKRVTLGRGPAGHVAVTQGLDVGTLVITEGSQRARPGQPVLPRPRQSVPGDAATPEHGG